MTSIFRKLTGRRKKTKPTTTTTTTTTLTTGAPSDIFSTESSHASDFDSSKTVAAANRPQHLQHPTSIITEGKHYNNESSSHQPQRRSRSRSNDRSSQRNTNNNNNNSKNTSSSVVERIGDSTATATPQRNGHSGTPSRANRGGDYDNWDVNRPSSASSGERIPRNMKSHHRFSFTNKSGSHSKFVHSAVVGSYDSEDETAATTSTTTATPLKRGRKPTPTNMFQTPPASSSSSSITSTRVVRVVSRKKKVIVHPASSSTPDDNRKEGLPPESALSSSPSPKHHSNSSQVTRTGNVISNGNNNGGGVMMTQEEIAKQIAHNKETERIARAAAALDNRGNEYFERGYYDKAMDAYTRALKLKRRTFHSMLEEADEIFDETAENEKLDSNDRDMDPKLLVSMATSINNIGYLRQRAGEATPDETMAAYKKSLRIKRRILGNDSLSVGKTLNNIGSVYYLKKEFEGALPAYEEALGIMQSNLGEDHPDVATVISNMGDVCLAMKKQDESLARYRTALNIRWSAFGEKDPRTMRLLEKIARIEIGDKMPTPRGINQMDRQVYDWDESELYDLDLRPISYELRLLKDQLKEDIKSVDLLEKKIAVGMVRDKLRIVRGMRELSEAQERGNASLGALEGSLSYGDDSIRSAAEDGFYSPEMSPAISSESRSEVQARVKERIMKLRMEKGLPLDGPVSSSSLDSAEKSTTPSDPKPPEAIAPKSDPEPNSKFLRSALYSTGQQTHRAALSSLKPDEIKDQADEIESALKLKKGIDNLRDFGRQTEISQQEQPDNVSKDAEERKSMETPGDDETIENSTEVMPEKDEAEAATPAKDEEHSADNSVVDNPSEGSVETNSDDEVVDDSSSCSSTNELAAATKMMHATWLGEIEG